MNDFLSDIRFIKERRVSHIRLCYSIHIWVTHFPSGISRWKRFITPISTIILSDSMIFYINPVEQLATIRLKQSNNSKCSLITPTIILLKFSPHSWSEYTTLWLEVDMESFLKKTMYVRHEVQMQIEWTLSVYKSLRLASISIDIV